MALGRIRRDRSFVTPAAFISKFSPRNDVDLVLALTRDTGVSDTSSVDEYLKDRKKKEALAKKLG
jgi:hypothetical protein